MRRIKSLTLVLILALSSCLVYHASAQNSVLPDIEIDCIAESPSGMVQIYVYPGATNAAYLSCTLYNPTVYSEDVEITVESGFLLAIGPGTVTVGPSAEEYFRITMIAEPETVVQTIIVETKAVVVAANGQDVGALPEGSDTAENMASIMEYSAPTIQLTEVEIDMVSGEDYDVGIIYGNNGNGDSDTMMIGVNEESRDELERAGFTISAIANSIEIDSGDSTTIEFEIRAPKDVTKDKYYTIEFYVLSEFSCRYEWCEYQSVFATILVIAEPDGGLSFLGENSVMIFSGIAGVLLVAAVAIVVLKKRKGRALNQDEEYEDEFEYEDELEYEDEEEFEDDLDDDFFDDL